MKRIRYVVALVGLMLMAALAMAQLGSILKGGGIVLLVDKFGSDMNKGLNKLTNTQDTRDVATKVVPIVSLGDKAYAGAAQVMGPRAKVETVKAVAQLEGAFFHRGVRLRAMIPIATKTPDRNPRRVEGVGVSGLVDIKL